MLADTDTFGGAGLIALVTALVTGVGTALVTVLTTLYKLRKDRRVDALTEYQGLVDRLQRDLDVHTQQLAAVQSRLTDCEVDRAELRGELKVQAALIRRLQVRTGDEAPGTVLPAVVVCDSSGIIMLASPAITPMLHWLPSELRGRNISVLMPERYRSDHQEAFEKAVTRTEPPWPDRVVVGHALTKNGNEVGVYVTLAAWRTRGGEWQIAAEIRLRSSTHVEDHQQYALAGGGRTAAPAPAPQKTTPSSQEADQ